MTADLRVCSVSDLDIDDESVDLILTDPPYPREFLDTWRDLGIFAARVLRPGGSLVAMSGHMFLPTVFSHLEASGLTYRWTIACMTPGANGRVWPVKMMQGWKPILWYGKGKPMPRRMREDRVVSRPDKRFHEWGQDIGVFMDLALSFSRLGETVCDPFLGGGTTAAAALLTRRRFVGCDIDEESVRKTVVRVAAVVDYLASAQPVATVAT